MTSELLDLVGRSFTFGEVPVASRPGEASDFRAVGLARLLPGRRGRRRQAITGRCLLSRVAHAHVHTVILDFGPMEYATPYWLAELRELVGDPDREAAVASLQDWVRDLAADAADPGPVVSSRLVSTHGLLWRDGQRVPVSSTYERTSKTLRVPGLLAQRSAVTDAFADFLADPGRGPDAFLLACTAGAGLEDEQVMLASTAPPERTAAARALFGSLDAEPARPAIVALAT